MHSKPICPLLLAMILCADSPNTGTKFQLECMHRFLRIEEHISRHEEALAAVHLTNKLLLRPGRSIDEICSIRGVACNDGIFEKFVWESICDDPLQRLTVDMSWLPPTTEVVHLKSVYAAGGVQTCQLPRSLKYLYLYMVRASARVALSEFDFCSLPSQMEDVHLHSVYLKGTLDLTLLSSKIQRISISGCAVQAVVIDNATIPRSLRAAVISTSMENLQWIVRHKAKKRDKRIVFEKNAYVYRSDFETERNRACTVMLSDIIGDIHRQRA